MVDMATTQDISLTASLGEYFSSSHFIVLYHSYFVSVSFFQNSKTPKDFICSYCLFTSGHLFYVSKTKKNKKIFLESNAKMEVQEFLESAHCFIFHLFSATPIELKF